MRRLRSSRQLTREADGTDGRAVGSSVCLGLRDLGVQPSSSDDDDEGRWGTKRETLLMESKAGRTMAGWLGPEMEEERRAGRRRRGGGKTRR